MTEVMDDVVEMLRKAKGWIHHTVSCALNDPGDYTGRCNCGAKQKWSEIDAALAHAETLAASEAREAAQAATIARLREALEWLAGFKGDTPGDANPIVRTMARHARTALQENPDG